MSKEKKLKLHYYDGCEQLELSGRKLRYRMIDFWRMKLSAITETMTRGSFAEFVVACALEEPLNEQGFSALKPNKAGNEPYDLDGPMIQTADGERRSRIEVKSTANVHLQLSAEKRQLDDSQLKFSIRKAIDWDSAEKKPDRHSDVYVFCYYKATSKSEDILNLDLWEFYVLPTQRIEADAKLANKNSISLYRLKKTFGLQPVGFGALYGAIRESLDTIH